MLPFVPGRDRSSRSPMARSTASEASSKSSSSKASRGIGPFVPGGRGRASASVNCAAAAAAAASPLPPPTIHVAEKARLVDYGSFTVAELRALCRGRKLKVSGIKMELVKRLTEDDNNTGEHRSVQGGVADSRENETPPEAWITRKKWSKAATLLFNLLMDEEALERLNKMSPEEVWNSSPLFRRYPLNDFVKYEKKMRETATKKLDIIKEEERAFKLHCAAFPRNAVNERGELYWDSHAAKKHLEDDVRSGKASGIAPSVLRSTRKEYMEFTKRTFQKHVNQEKGKQRSKPYWVVERNKQAQQIIDKVLEEEKGEWKAENRGYEKEDEVEEDKKVCHPETQ